MTRTITTYRHHGLNPGDTIEIKTLDRRWWMRLWCFVTRRPAPMRTERMVIGKVDDNHTITI